jgi:hypothetical protein
MLKKINTSWIRYLRSNIITIANGNKNNLIKLGCDNFLLQLFIFSLISWFILNLNKSSLFLPYDGAYMRELVKFSFEWLTPSFNYPLNPLQGLSGMGYLINYWLIPSTFISYLFYGINPNIVVINFISSIQLFCSIWFLAKCLKNRKEIYYN